MTVILKTCQLTKAFGNLIAVNQVSFELQRGELLALIGPNGAGKSTCFNMLMGQIKTTSGDVYLADEKITGMAPRQIWRKGVGRTFQITATYTSMTVIENVQTALMSYRHEMFSPFPYATHRYRNEALKLLKMVGMADQAERHCAVLAYGDLKRMELAIALAHEPMLLLMDEPTAGMAVKERIALMQLISDIVASSGVSVLFTEHDMDVVFSHAHRILVLNRGELIAEGSAEKIRNNPTVKEVYLGGGTVFKTKKALNA